MRCDRYFFGFFFFFSSRRRHTRSLCDWSSDVCSSDLRPRGRRRSAGSQRQGVDARRSGSRGVRLGAEAARSEEHTSELQSHSDLVCRLLLEKKKNKNNRGHHYEKNKQNIRGTADDVIP